MSRHSISIEYNQSLKGLESLLAGVQRAGDFMMWGAAEIPMPRVEVEGVGLLSFPILPTQIATLVQQASRAPYGRGEKTIVDESVRKVWQIPADQVRISGKSWESCFGDILKRVSAGLGCEGKAVSAELYKLLVYDPGGFFLSHRDTEKTIGMFGTLVVVLPSLHRGGELIVRHAGREMTVDLGSAEISEIKFAAFYADCEHEVRPLAEGHRVCLVYNLVHQPGAKGGGMPLLAPDYERQTTAAAALLKEHLTEPGAPAKIAWLLEHQYSPANLSFAGLKSVDAARAKVLLQAADRADCVAHLGIVHIEESGSAESGGFGYRRRRGRYDDSADDFDHGNDVDFEIVEVCDSRQFVSQWRDPKDQPVEYGEIPLTAGELLPDGALQGEKPDQQRLMEASGNEGASFERSYHRAVVVLWARERYTEVLLQSGVAAALPYLKDKIRACAGKRETSATRKDAVALASRMVTAWIDTPRYYSSFMPGRPDQRGEMLTLITQLGDAQLLRQFITGVVMPDYNGSENNALVTCAPVLGSDHTTTLYGELVRMHLRIYPGDCIELVRAMASAEGIPANPEWLRALRKIAEALVDRLDEVGTPTRTHAWTDWHAEVRQRPLDSAAVTHLIRVLIDLDAAPVLAVATGKFAARPDVFDPVTILVPALKTVGASKPATDGLWEHCAQFLLKRSEHPPESPKDWRQSTPFPCTCEDCLELKDFALDPVAQAHRFRMRQDRRRHLQRMIEQHSLDMSHDTDTRGTPQTLVCTKNRRSHQERCEQYLKDIAAMAALSDIKTKPRVPAALMRAMEAARQRAREWSPA